MISPIVVSLKVNLYSIHCQPVVAE